MLIQSRVEDSTQRGLPFDYHRRCKITKTTHLCFADDLMIFCGKSIHSAGILSQALKDFSELSGLIPNNDKSCIFFTGSNYDYQQSLLNLFPFTQGALPVRYLGVPLITTKLTAHDCKVLVEAITRRIGNWTTKFLSFAGRIQLIQSVLCSMQSFWNGLFILPKKIITQVEQIIRRFLWKGPQLSTGGAKVAWADLTFPLDEGGLGIKRLHTWNVAAMGKHIWNLCHPQTTSSWALWARANLLRGRSLWDINPPSSSS